MLPGSRFDVTSGVVYRVLLKTLLRPRRRVRRTANLEIDI